MPRVNAEKATMDSMAEKLLKIEKMVLDLDGKVAKVVDKPATSFSDVAASGLEKARAAADKNPSSLERGKVSADVRPGGLKRLAARALKEPARKFSRSHSLSLSDRTLWDDSDSEEEMPEVVDEAFSHHNTDGPSDDQGYRLQRQAQEAKRQLKATSSCLMISRTLLFEVYYIRIRW